MSLVRAERQGLHVYWDNTLHYHQALSQDHQYTTHDVSDECQPSLSTIEMKTHTERLPVLQKNRDFKPHMMVPCH